MSWDRLVIFKDHSGLGRAYWVTILILLRVYTSARSTIDSHRLIPIRPLMMAILFLVPVNTPHHFWAD